MAEAKGAGLRAFQIVGGEPTLEPEVFCAIVEEGLRLGMKCHRPPTNCWIARDRGEAERFFARLSEIGFSAGFRISLDRFHGAVPVEYTAAFIAMSSEYFRLGKYSIGCCDIDEGESERRLAALAEALCAEGLMSEYAGGKMITERGDIKVGFWAPTRPTWGDLADGEFLSRRVDTGMDGEGGFRRDAPIGRFGCLGERGVGYLWVEPDGVVRPCCGNAAPFIDALVAGNIFEDTVGGIIERAGGSRLLSALAEGGPVRVAEMAGAGDRFFGEMYSHRCELCYRVLGDESVRDYFETSP